MSNDLSTTLKRYVFPEKMQRIKYVFLSLLEDKQQFKLGVVMKGYLTLFLACFSFIFSRFWRKKGGVLEQLPMILKLL